jgi:hypothetical protein
MMEKTPEYKQNVKRIKSRTAFINARVKRFKDRMAIDPGYAHYSIHEKYILTLGFRAGLEMMYSEAGIVCL